MWWRSVLFMAIFFGLFVYIIPNLLWLVSWLVAKLFSVKVNYAPFGWTGLALVLILWITLAYGHFIGRFRSEVNTVEYASKDVPKAFDGFKIVHISDLHVDSFDGNPEALQRVLDKVNEQKPDIILFTGDMTTAEMKNIRLHEKALKSLKAKYGVVSVMGNHDFFIYCPEYRNDAQRCKAADELTAYERNTLGWTVLRNENIILHQNTSLTSHHSSLTTRSSSLACVEQRSKNLSPLTTNLSPLTSNDSIAIAGVDNINGNQGFHTIQKGDLKKAMTGLDGIFTVLMTHDPSHWEAEVLPKSHAQITLSGHTHAAQVRIFGWSLANLAFRECDGRYDQDGRMLYVNAGIGCTAPVRIDCPSEVTVIKLKSLTPNPSPTRRGE